MILKLNGSISFVVFIFIILSINISCARKINHSESGSLFKSFWNTTINELNEAPLNPILLRKEEYEGKVIQLYRLKSYKNIDFHVYVSEPKKEGLYETIIKFSSLEKNDYTFDQITKDELMLQQDIITMKVDIRGQGLSTDQIPFENYLSNGNGSKESYIYRGAYMDAVRAVDFIAANPKSNGKILSMGGSQGGLLSLVATALNPKVDFCIANYPFLSGVKSYKRSAWPFNSINRGISTKKALKILVYYDAVNFARMVKVPVFISCAELDDKTPLEGIRKVYDNINVRDKQFHVVPCEGHGCSSKSTFVNRKQQEFIEKNFNNIE